MILIDTSVFINYLRKSDNEKTEQFNEILDKGIPFGINYFSQDIFGVKKERDNGSKYYRLLNCPDGDGT